MGIIKPAGLSFPSFKSIFIMILMPALAPVVRKMLSELDAIPPSRWVMKSATALRTASRPY